MRDWIGFWDAAITESTVCWSTVSAVLDVSVTLAVSAVLDAPTVSSRPSNVLCLSHATSR
jgi:hypothetical protein